MADHIETSGTIAGMWKRHFCIAWIAFALVVILTAIGHGGGAGPADSPAHTASTQTSPAATKSSAALENPPAGFGIVEMKIFSPDGTPVANKRAKLAIWGNAPRSDKPTAAMDVSTDEHGSAQFYIATGRLQIDVTVDQLGYGATGEISVFPGVKAEAELPPLARLTHVEGKVPAEFLKPNMTVTMTQSPEVKVDCAVDADGHFSTWLRCGNWWISGKVGETTIAAGSIAACGDPIRGVHFEKQTDGSTFDPTPELAYPEPADPVATWACGTIRDERGEPVANARVCVIWLDYAGIGMEQQSLAAQTDGKGRYEIKGPTIHTLMGATLVATKEGMTPSLAWLSQFAFGQRPIPKGTTQPVKIKWPQPPPCDLAMTSKGGSMDVTVLMDDKPLPGAFVKLWRDGADLSGTQNQIGAMSDDVKRAEQFVCPSAATDSSGVAHFEHLLPGNYTIRSTRADVKPGAYINGWTLKYTDMAFVRPVNQPFGVAYKQIVQMDRRTTSRLTMSFPRPVTQLKLDKDSFTDLPDNVVTFTQFSEEYHRQFADSFGSGTASVALSEPGLWCAHYQYDAATQPSTRPTVLNAEALVASSSLLGPKTSRALTAGKVDTSGSIDVELRDALGKPARGVVSIICGTSPMQIGSTDDHGHIIFPNVIVYDYWRIDGHIYGHNASTVWMGGVDADYKGRTRVHRKEDIRVGIFEQKHIVMQERPAGFATGQIYLPAGEKIQNFFVQPGFAFSDDFFLDSSISNQCFVDAMGRYIVGPMEPGEAELYLSRNGRSTYGNARVQISAGQVTTVNLAGERPKAATEPEDSVQSSGDWDYRAVGEAGTATSVVLADQKTPACGAQVYISENYGLSSPVGDTDPLGNVHYNPAGLNVRIATDAPPRRRMMIALLPGTTGAAFLDLPSDPKGLYKIVLPESIIVTGKLTVGNRPVGKLSSRVRILAQFQGEGNLNDILSVWATPDDNGQFELIGMTPGTYKVQAMLDNIWLSETRSVVIKNASPDPIALNIGEPGGPVEIRVTDRAGKAVVGQRVTVDRPDGPFTEQFWPQCFATDGAGLTCIPAIEVGPQNFHIGYQIVTASAFPAAEGKTAVVAVVLGLKK